MARRRNASSADVPFHVAAARLLKDVLRPDLRERAKEPAVDAVLRAQWEALRRAGRSGEREDEHREYALEQVGAAWLLSVLFVRVLEDRGLLAERRVAGAGANDNEHLFGELFPNLGPRDYLLTVFREVASLPGAEVLGPDLNPAWRLLPSQEAARAMLDLFRDADADGVLRWRFEARDTRALGDLYEKLSEGVQERFALLQTPDFVEAFILDRTLTPALEHFGLDGLNLLDPTCGSGHFLLGAFRRLLDAERAAHPGLDVRAAAARALAHVHGSDVNPYAVAIARFRLALAVIDAAGVAQLADVPADGDVLGLSALARNVVVADSLILGGAAQGELASLATDREAQRVWGTAGFDFEDPAAVNALFAKPFHAVVGNPPYIACRDAALRESYRARYPNSAKGKYTLSAPFTERFFTLATAGGYVGLINSNAFMKREFGRSLIEKVLPLYDLTLVVDSAGAFIPGHDTPTVMLFGRHQRPQRDGVRVVMGRRGEPGTPADPAHGEVWTSITTQHANIGFENEFVTIAEVPRATFAKHPWSLGGGGASDLKELIEERCPQRVGKVAEDIGFASFTGLDDAFILGLGCGRRLGMPDLLVRPLVVGESVRDWCVAPSEEAFTPYDPESKEPIALDRPSAWGHFLWHYRVLAENVVSFGGKTRKQGGENWWEWYRWQAERYRAPFRIAFAFVATHNHFVLDRGGKVFKQTAPIIKLPATATEDDHLALLAWLNSSASCFWMKVVCYPKATSNKDVNLDRGDPAANRFEFAGTALLPLPIPASATATSPLREAPLALTREIERLSILRAAAEPAVVLASWTHDSGATLKDALLAAQRNGDDAFRQMVVLQEELDWHFYAELGLCDGVTQVRGGAAPEERPFAWETDEAPASLDAPLRAQWTRRRQLLARAPLLRMLEDAMYKRPWEGRRGVFGHGALTWDERVIAAGRQWLLDQIEALLSQGEPAAVSMIDAEVALLAQPKAQAVFELLAAKRGDDTLALLSQLAREESVPCLAAQRYSEEGLAKRSLWEHTWSLQRREDAGEAVGEIPVPPKYEREEYRDPRYWSLRGKLDVPRERFIAYPGAEIDARAPLFGWAGWDHLGRARALARLYTQRKDEDHWDRERLRPLLAGIAELVPWLMQWHDAPDPELDGQGQGRLWKEFVESESHALKWNAEELRAWRPTAPQRATAAKKPTARAKKAKPAEE